MKVAPLGSMPPWMSFVKTTDNLMSPSSADAGPTAATANATAMSTAAGHLVLLIVAYSFPATSEEAPPPVSDSREPPFGRSSGRRPAGGDLL
jgi:hypothetical protein